jgi:hypothetical protein
MSPSCTHRTICLGSQSLFHISTKLIDPAIIRSHWIRTASAWAFGFLISWYQIFAFGKNAPNLQDFS